MGPRTHLRLQEASMSGLTNAACIEPHALLAYPNDGASMISQGLYGTMRNRRAWAEQQGGKGCARNWSHAVLVPRSNGLTMLVDPSLLNVEV